MGELRLSRDRKVAPVGSFQASRARWIPTIRNSLGLPAGDSCPGRTGFCVSCYGVRSEQSAGVLGALRANHALLLEAETIGAMHELLDRAVSRFVRSARRMGLPPEDLLFRIHWDGDFYSEDYACAWGLTIHAHPEVRFWAYTRSFTDEVDVVPILDGLPNLALYLSVDAENAARAGEVLAAWPYARAALCADVEEKARDLLPGRRSVACPENVGRVALMTDGRGACATCRLCPDAVVDVRFLTKHPRVGALPVAVPVTIATPRCANPECSNGVRRPGGLGRPPSFCSVRCRHRAAYLRREARAG